MNHRPRHESRKSRAIYSPVMRLTTILHYRRRRATIMIIIRIMEYQTIMGQCRRHHRRRTIMCTTMLTNTIITIIGKLSLYKAI